MPSAFFGPWLQAVAKRAAGPAQALLMGTPDERTANRIGRDAVIRALTSLLPEADPGDIESLTRIIDEHFSPSTLVGLRDDPPAPSIVAKVNAALRSQLEPLYAPLHEGEPAAIRIGLNVSLDMLAERITDEIAFLAAFEAPTHFLQALRQEHAALLRPQSDAAPQIAVRYFICKAFDGLVELTNHDFTSLPASNVRWIETPVSSFWRQLAQVCGSQYRNGQVSGGSFDTSAAYLQRHPTARPTRPDDHLPYYEVIRPITEADLPVLFNGDQVSELLARDGVPAEDLGVAAGYYEHCGANGQPTFQEVYLTRPIWGVLAEIRLNVEAPEALMSIVTFGQSGGLTTFDQHATSSTTTEFPTPRAPVDSSEAVVLPVATFIPRVPELPSHLYVLGEHYDPDGRSETLSESSIRRSLPMEVWGPTHLPRMVRISGSAPVVTVRPFDPALVYVVDREWMIGSCPHIIEITDSGHARYRCSVFTGAEVAVQHVSLAIPGDVSWILIAELEPETTLLLTVAVNDTEIATDVVLLEGEVFKLPVKRGDTVLHLSGSYQPYGDAYSGLSVHRNALIRDFLARV